MGEALRVAVFTESFLPHRNGVTNSVLHLLAHLRARGHEALVFAPKMRGVPAEYEGYRVLPQASIAMPGYPEVRITMVPDFVLYPQLAEFAPHVVHLASPLVLGYEAVQAARALGVPAVAIYQTEVTSYAARYGFPQLEALLWWRLKLLHGLASRTLAPSTFSMEQLAAQGIPRLHRWGRGVDLDLFSPTKRSDEWRRRIAPDGQRIVGYVGRLAPEKQVDALSSLSDLPDTRLVVVGKGPAEDSLRTALPDAVSLGQLTGDALAEAMASLDLFVHTGEFETFCQTIQEAHASGVPVVAPRRGGPVDLVREGVDGYLYEPGQPADLRVQVERALGAGELERLRGASRDSVADRSWASVFDELIGHYRAAIAS